MRLGYHSGSVIQDMHSKLPGSGSLRLSAVVHAGSYLFLFWPFVIRQRHPGTPENRGYLVVFMCPGKQFRAFRGVGLVSCGPGRGTSRGLFVGPKSASADAEKKAPVAVKNLIVFYLPSILPRKRPDHLGIAGIGETNSRTMQS